MECCLVIKNDTQPGIWILLGFFQMSETESLCVHTHVFSLLCTDSPKRQFPFSTHFASLPCPGRLHLSAGNIAKSVALIFYIHPGVSVRGKIKICLMNTIISLVTGRA